MSDQNIVETLVDSSKRFDGLEIGAYTTNEVKVDAIDVENRHVFFAQVHTLDEESDEVGGGWDPITQREFAVGDKVVTLIAEDGGKKLSGTFFPDSIAYIHPDLTLTRVEEGNVVGETTN